MVEVLVEVLKPFKVATVILSSESSPTLPLVYLTMLKFDKCLAPKDADEFMRELNIEDDNESMRTAIVKMEKIKCEMKKNLKKRLAPCEDVFKMATVLDPKYKALLLHNEPEMKEELINELIKRGPVLPKIKTLREIYKYYIRVKSAIV